MVSGSCSSLSLCFIFWFGFTQPVGYPFRFSAFLKEGNETFEKWERLVKEAIHIKLAPPGCKMNKDEGMDLSPLWMNAILAMRDRQRRMQDRRRTPPRVPRPPSTPPPNIRRPTPTLRRLLTSHAAPSPTTRLRPRPLT